MLRTGREYLEGLGDGRVVYFGGERVEDVVSHPLLGAAAETVSALYDLKLDPACRSDLVVEDGDGAPYSAYFLTPRNAVDLGLRLRCHRRIADATFGLLGRPPDHVASLIAGLCMGAQILDEQQGRPFAASLRAYYREARERDIYVVYAVVPNRRERLNPNSGLRIVSEDERGVVVRGVKSLATGAVLADEIWVGNLQPLSEGQVAEAVTFAVPCNAPGVQLHARGPLVCSAFEQGLRPLSARYDEGDAVVVFDDVRVDWERVFVHCDTKLSSELYLRTPAHCLANHQSAVRAAAKFRLLTGLARRVAHATGALEIDAVQDVLGRLAALEATAEGLVEAQLASFESRPNGWAAPNLRYVYAALSFAQESLPVAVEAIRELSGAGAFRYPRGGSSAGELDSLDGDFDVLKLAWDLVGSGFAGRQQQYEKHYAGPPFVVRRHNCREAPWEEFDAMIARLLPVRRCKD